MIDIHNHILPGIDDGAANLDESLLMARAAEQDGITDIIATPHLSEPALTENEIYQRTDRLNTSLQEAGIAIRVHPGAEIAMHMLSHEAHWIGLAGSRHLLVEFSPYNIMPSADRIFSYLIKQGYQIIIAHPERHPAVIEKPERLFKLIAPGVSLQITAGSLTGDFGSAPQTCARHLIKKKTVEYIATDAHNADRRPPILSAAIQPAAKLADHETALSLVDGNPRMILTG